MGTWILRGVDVASARRGSEPRGGVQYHERINRVNEPRRHTTKYNDRADEIYRAAARLFFRRGYAATSLQDIASEVGLLKGSLYYYINSKEQLLWGITETIHDAADRTLRFARDVPGTPTDRLAALIKHHIAAFTENLDLIRVFYTDYRSLDPEHLSSVLSRRLAYERFVHDLIAQGQRTGEFSSDEDPETSAKAILTMINSVFIWFRPGRKLTIDDVGRYYAKFAVRGLQNTA
jgi:AcrR family transcriptional regulator